MNESETKRERRHIFEIRLLATVFLVTLGLALPMEVAFDEGGWFIFAALIFGSLGMARLIWIW